MKKLLLLFVCIIFLFSMYSCASDDPSRDTQADTAAKSSTTTTIITTTSAKTPDELGKYGKNIGNPLYDYYKGQSYPRNPWDMIIYDGKLYVGGGDYSNNVKEMAIYAYDLTLGEWEQTLVTVDHSISRFVELDGELYASGVDSALDGWDYGNYYKLSHNGKWETHSTVFGGVHVYAIEACAQGILFGIGTGGPSNHPAKLLDPETGRFSELPMYRDGKNILSSENYDCTRIRIYNLFRAGNDTYAFAVETRSKTTGYNIYKYTDRALEYIGDFKPNTVPRYTRHDGARIWQDLFNASVERDGYCYFSSGYLYKTEDFTSFTRLTPPDESVVSDLVMHDGALYALSFTDGNFTEFDARIWKIEKDDSFTLLREFKTKGGYPLSFETDGESFFVGIGNTQNSWGIGYIRKLDIADTDAE